jgi:hypothetical protein
VRQVLGAVAQFEKATTVAKLAAARKRKRLANGKCEGRKSLAETRPEAVALAKALGRRKPKGGKMSLRAVSAAMAGSGLPQRARAAVQPEVYRGHAGRASAVNKLNACWSCRLRSGQSATLSKASSGARTTETMIPFGCNTSQVLSSAVAAGADGLGPPHVARVSLEPARPRRGSRAEGVAAGGAGGRWEHIWRKRRLY